MNAAPREVKTTCCYCGVGCGILAGTDGAQVTAVRGDPDHPANFGRLCSKGANLHHSASPLLRQQVRALAPELRRGRAGPRSAASWDDSLDFVAANNAALINLHLATGQIGKPGAGPFSLTGQPNAMGGREVGGMANLLSGHRDLNSAQDRAEVAALWGVPDVPAKVGKTAVELFDALADGSVKMVWIACTNPAQSMPDQKRVRAALEKAELVREIEARFGIDGAGVLRYDDAKRGNARHLLVRDGKLGAVALAGDIAAEAWLRQTLEAESPVAALGRLLLAPSATAPQGFKARGRIVCGCFNVAESEIKAELGGMAAGVDRLAGLQGKLKCGTNCGSCLPELRQMAHG